VTVDSPSVDIDTDNGPCNPGCDTTDDTGTFDETPEPEPAPEFTEPDEPAGEACDTTKPTEPDTAASPNENSTPKRTSTADPAVTPDARRPITVAKNDAGATDNTDPSVFSIVQFATPTFESHTHNPTDCFVKLDTEDNDDNAKPTGTFTDNDGTALEGNEPTLPNNTVTSETPTPATGTDDASAPSPSTNTTRDDAPPPTTDEPDEPSTPAAATPAGPNKPATINTDTTTDRARRSQGLAARLAKTPS
jgi:hypothetical protein